MNMPERDTNNCKLVVEQEKKRTLNLDKRRNNSNGLTYLQKIIFLITCLLFETNTLFVHSYLTIQNNKIFNKL